MELVESDSEVIREDGRIGDGLVGSDNNVIRKDGRISDGLIESLMMLSGMLVLIFRVVPTA